MSITPLKVVAGLGLLAINTATGGLIDAIVEIAEGPDDHIGRPVVVPRDLHKTAAPVVGAGGLVACTRCQQRVPYSSMSLNEHGYFCARCGQSQSL